MESTSHLLEQIAEKSKQAFYGGIVIGAVGVLFSQFKGVIPLNNVELLMFYTGIELMLGILSSIAGRLGQYMKGGKKRKPLLPALLLFCSGINVLFGVSWFMLLQKGVPPPGLLAILSIGVVIFVYVYQFQPVTVGSPPTRPLQQKYTEELEDEENYVGKTANMPLWAKAWPHMKKIDFFINAIMAVFALIEIIFNAFLRSTPSLVQALNVLLAIVCVWMSLIMYQRLFGTFCEFRYTWATKYPDFPPKGRDKGPGKRIAFLGPLIIVIVYVVLQNPTPPWVILVPVMVVYLGIWISAAYALGQSYPKDIIAFEDYED
jgi:hypothetical protein